jgi:hypothetical protein
VNENENELPDPKPHLFAGKTASDSCYARGCRCSACRRSHAQAAHQRLQAQRNGTWTDRRKRASPLLLEALDRSGLTEGELLQFLMNHGGAAPQVIQPPLIMSTRSVASRCLGPSLVRLVLSRPAKLLLSLYRCATACFDSYGAKPNGPAGSCRGRSHPPQRSGSASGWPVTRTRRKSSSPSGVRSSSSRATTT